MNIELVLQLSVIAVSIYSINRVVKFKVFMHQKERYDSKVTSKIVESCEREAEFKERMADIAIKVMKNNKSSNETN